MASVTPGDLPSRIRLASRLVVGSWPARVYLGLVAVAYGFGVVTADSGGYAFLVLVTLPWGMIPIPGEWYWALLLVAGGLINAAILTILTQVHRGTVRTPSRDGPSSP
jgi:hypothetical protein